MTDEPTVTVTAALLEEWAAVVWAACRFADMDVNGSYVYVAVGGLSPEARQLAQDMAP